MHELQELFHQQAIDYGIYPLRDAGSPRHGEFSVPHALDGITKMTYTTAHVRMPESSVLNLKNCSYRITADIEILGDTDHGVIVCQGGNMAGWSLYLSNDGRPVFHYNLYGHEHFVCASATPLSRGAHRVVITFAYDGGFGAGGTVVMNVDGNDVAGGRIDKTVPLVYSMSGETFDVGIDTGSPVGNYPHDYRCTARIDGVTLERLSEVPEEIAARVREGMFAASLTTQ
jgi:arylsulfatase